MGRPGIGNPGNRGGGRPSEKEVHWHLDQWERDNLIEELRAKIASGSYAIRDMWLFKALSGCEPILKQAADKVLADLHQHGGTGGGPIMLGWEK